MPITIEIPQITSATIAPNPSNAGTAATVTVAVSFTTKTLTEEAVFSGDIQSNELS